MHPTLSMIAFELVVKIRNFLLYSTRIVTYGSPLYFESLMTNPRTITGLFNMSLMLIRSPVRLLEMLKSANLGMISSSAVNVLSLIIKHHIGKIWFTYVDKPDRLICRVLKLVLVYWTSHAGSIQTQKQSSKSPE